MVVPTVSINAAKQAFIPFRGDVVIASLPLGEGGAQRRMRETCGA